MSQEEPQLPYKLHCCHGEIAPPSVLDGWRRFLRLSGEVKREIVGLLGPLVLNPSRPEHQNALEGFCRKRSIPREDAALIAQSCNFLLGRASALDLSPEDFQEDLSALSSEDPEGAQIMLSLHNAVRAELRNTILRGSLRDHGKLFVGMDWRVDDVDASDRGIHLKLRVVLLTLRYQEGSRSDRITLQLTPEALKEFRELVDRFTA